MKKILFFSMLLVVALTGCKNYDDDIDDINARLAALETWEASVNTNITALQTAITALQGKDYVTGVVALSDGSGYQITFQNSGTITIKNGTNGKDGVTPVIGVKQDTDGYYYWTVDTGSGATWLKDANGKMIRTTGDTPKMKIGDDGYWYVAADGVNFVTTGVKAQGDAVFAENGVTVGSTNVTFTLADGTTFAVPLYQSLKIAEDITDEIIEISKDQTPLAITLPKGLKKTDFISVLAKIECSGDGSDLQTRGATSNGVKDESWGVKMVMPTYQSDGLCNADAKVLVSQPLYMTDNNLKGLLTVILSMKDGTTLTASRTLVSYRNTFERVAIGDVIYSDGTCSPYSSFETYGHLRTPVGVCFSTTRAYDGVNDTIYVNNLDSAYKLGYRPLTKPAKFHGYMVALKNASTSAVLWIMAKSEVSSFNTAVNVSAFTDGWYLPSCAALWQLCNNVTYVDFTLASLQSNSVQTDLISANNYWSSTQNNKLIQTVWASDKTNANLVIPYYKNFTKFARMITII